MLKYPQAGESFKYNGGFARWTIVIVFEHCAVYVVQRNIVVQIAQMRIGVAKFKGITCKW
jgi:hypothetical protein